MRNTSSVTFSTTTGELRLGALQASNGVEVRFARDHGLDRITDRTFELPHRVEPEWGFLLLGHGPTMTRQGWVRKPDSGSIY